MKLKETAASVALAAALLAIPGLASAHPGHALGVGFASGFVHPWTGVDHILAMVAVGLFAATLGGRALWAVPLSFVSLMALGGAVGMAGVSLPLVETMIALSVVALGAAVAVQRRWNVAAAMAFVAVFAVFHGYAHGAEAPASVAGGQFGLGFLLATASLHLVGVGLGLASRRLRPGLAVRLNQIGGAAIALAGAGLLFAN